MVSIDCRFYLFWEIPKKYIPEFEKFKLGKYSELNSLYKQRIFNFHNICNSESRLAKVLYKHSDLKSEIEDVLNCTISNNQELSSVPDLKVETYPSSNKDVQYSEEVLKIHRNFFNPRPKNNSVDAVADKRYTSGKVRHLFVEMPDNNFEPRLADQRVGYCSEKVTDLSSYNYFPAVDLINKWRLIKKDPKAQISEPVTPIDEVLNTERSKTVFEYVVEFIVGQDGQ